ncbi:MAG: hypothetical protein JOZ91_11795 [Candidatus Eremiobacteraeota bacterium]|nr:hypothetical protein [Candidatus Eremiobacteraeota bacterium]MBV8595015.1 hypothetical protein [Candidatus Eremiobacteraeota bacterium]
MFVRSISEHLGVAALLGVLLIFGGSQTTAATSQPPPSVAGQVKAIDTDCLAIQDAVMALKPIQLVYANSTWKIASDADVTVAERTKASVMIANVYRQGKNYAWVQTHAWNQKGNQSATQLCFRQKDGSLERAKQAADFKSLNGADAAVGYYTPSGTIIFQSALFEANDPKIAKKITALPYYQQLP